jgi:hypothetical protein
MTTRLRIPERMYEFMAGSDTWAEMLAGQESDDDLTRTVLRRVGGTSARKDGSRWVAGLAGEELLVIRERAEWLEMASTGHGQDPDARSDLIAAHAVIRAVGQLTSR